ncbi:MarR family winged helix-turn-helix transcriptional regulator [Kitasatospora sp. NBC_01287]|uniref:MarR family winged helix-turn-helix transcriptional regulator n=1 Tax=Kitasatospora sp. NBC_01287 TaxID=2903573 RepID=UPI00224EA0DB|nr:MarR family winged helix-turn-helix transcriptional regulator [Kitasatospora sp. NBC_01287]MCX4745497.1 MarR family winged helix-turn-helix transcriptional regulator [Kitasatospora sp. NBC_01287]
MNAATPVPLAATLSYRLGTVGTIASHRYTERVETLGLKLKDVVLLHLLQDGGPASQLEVARLMGVAPSLVVTVADRLEALGAIRRLRDPDDRRRQQLVLTEPGRELLARCTTLAQELDAELTADLDEAARQALNAALGTLAAGLGLPT